MSVYELGNVLVKIQEKCEDWTGIVQRGTGNHASGNNAVRNEQGFKAYHIRGRSALKLKSIFRQVEGVIC